MLKLQSYDISLAYYFLISKFFWSKFLTVNFNGIRFKKKSPNYKGVNFTFSKSEIKGLFNKNLKGP